MQWSHLKSIVRPRSKLEMAVLVIERKVSDVDLTGAVQFTRYWPEDVALKSDHRIGWHHTISISCSAIRCNSLHYNTVNRI